MNKNIIAIIVVGLVVASFFFYLGSRSSITGNVVKENPEKVINSEPKEDSLSQESKVVSEVDYQVKVEDKLTKESLEYAEIYLDGKLVGKTSSDGELVIENVEIGRHNLRAFYKGEESDVLTKDVTESDKVIVIYITAPRTITLELKDSETNKPVDNENVFLKSIDGKAKFNPILTTDEGKAQFSEVLPGDYVISIERFPNKPADMVTIGASDLITADVDMPNPKFRGSMICNPTSPLLGDSWIECNVNIKNEDYNRGMNSIDTSVLVILYTKKKGEDFKNVGQQPLYFEDISVGKDETRTTKKFYEYSRFDEETKVLAIVYDGWKYTPEDYSKIGGIELSQDLFDKLTTNVVDWCASNVGECVEGAVKVAGTIATAV
ncbi:MAG: hypothetical protein AABX73_00480 [Nanoarchaeota archaeon]